MVVGIARGTGLIDTSSFIERVNELDDPLRFLERVLDLDGPLRFLVGLSRVFGRLADLRGTPRLSTLKPYAPITYTFRCRFVYRTNLYTLGVIEPLKCIFFPSPISIPACKTQNE